MITHGPVRGVFSYLQYPGLVTLPGLEQVRLFQHREVPYGPLWYLTGLEMTEYGVGTATFRLPVTGWLQSPAGVVPGGVLAFAADGSLASAIATALGPRRFPTTADLMFNFVRPPARDSESIIVRSQLVHEGTAQALSEATIEDSQGHLLGRAATRCVITDVPGDLPAPPAFPVPWPEYDGPHPFQKPPEGEILPQQVWDTVDGIDLLRGWGDGTVPRSPLSNLIGAELRHVEPGVVSCAMPASEWFCGMQGALYGGGLALLADYAIHGAVQSLLPAGYAWATLDLTVRFVRHLSPRGEPLTATARVVHRGRRVAVVTAQVSQAGQEVAVLADAAVMLLPGRPWGDVARLTDEPHELTGQERAPA